MNDLLHPNEIYETGEPTFTPKRESDLLPRTERGMERATAHRHFMATVGENLHHQSPEDLLAEMEDPIIDPEDLKSKTGKQLAMGVDITRAIQRRRTAIRLSLARPKE